MRLIGALKGLSLTIAVVPLLLLVTASPASAGSEICTRVTTVDVTIPADTGVL